mgnify:CR=1 FL=1
MSGIIASFVEAKQRLELDLAEKAGAPMKYRRTSSILASFAEGREIEHEKRLKPDSNKLLEHLKNEKLARRQRRAANLTKLPGYKAQKKADDEKSASNNKEKFRSMDEHKIKLDDLYQRLDVDPERGLTDKEVEIKRNIFGNNTLTEKKKTPWYVNLAHEFTGFFPLMLFCASGMSLLLFGLNATDPSTLYLAIALLTVIFLTSTTTFLQNQKAEGLMESFKNFIPQKTRCLRNGAWTEIPAAKLVPGDIVEVKGGDKIPADIRIIVSNEMKVDNSSLTGESDALLRTPECTHPENPLETMNLAFFGTLCKEGSAKAIVVSIGDNTVIGQIAELAAGESMDETPLVKEINNFVTKMCMISFTFGACFFGLGFILGFKIVTNVEFAIGIIVANMPEGLIATLTVCMTLAAQRLAAASVLVKNLGSVETLGCTTVICSDKTGTLTQNKMTVANVWYDGKIRKGDNYQKMPHGFKFQYDIDSEGFRSLHESAILCSEAIFNNSTPLEKFAELEKISNPAEREKAQHKIEQTYQNQLANKLWLDRPTIGDASETALIKFFQPVQDIVKTREQYPVLSMNDGTETRMPFNSTNKFALNIVKYKTENSHHAIFLKGAPERVWVRCSHVLNEGKLEPLDEKWITELEKINLTFGKNGERVLGFAKYHLPADEFPENFQYNCKSLDQFNFPMNKFVFCGFVSLIDPPREIVPFSVIKCKTAGIKVIMVTGDQPVTAAAIAREVNIFDKHVKTVNEIAEEKGISLEAAMEYSDAIVIHGDLITEACKEDELLPESERGKRLSSWLSKPQIVFARTSPAQKLIIVQGCQKLGHVVAVTGDGVNDSPAIKKADIGVAMGITGSDVAKDAADMVLLTDDFSAIVVGVEEGRKIMDNLKKCLVYALTSNIPELVPFLSMVFFGFPLPLSNILMLCINLGTDIFPSFSLAWEDGELDLMLRPPRAKTDHLFTARLITTAYFQMGALQSLGAFLCYFYIMNDFGFPIWSLFRLMYQEGLWSASTDPYDPYLYNLGNSNVQLLCEQAGGKVSNDSTNYQSIDWVYLRNMRQDLRNVFIECGATVGTVQEFVKWGPCYVQQLSSHTLQPNCYSTEALKYAQTGVFFGIVMCQFTNVFAVKTKKLSIYYQGIKNKIVFAGIASELTLTVILSCMLFIQTGIGSRDVIFFHYGLPAIPFSILQMILEETRKFAIRHGKPGKKGKPNWFHRNSYF